MTDAKLQIPLKVVPGNKDGTFCIRDANHCYLAQVGGIDDSAHGPDPKQSKAIARLFARTANAMIAEKRRRETMP